MHLQGRAVAEYLSGPHTVRDGLLLNVAISYLGESPIVRLEFKAAERNGGCIVTLELQDVVEFDHSYSENVCAEIEMIKCLWTDDGEFYLSLDPYDEHEQLISDQDGQRFRSKSVKLTAINAPSPG